MSDPTVETSVLTLTPGHEPGLHPMPFAMGVSSGNENTAPPMDPIPGVPLGLEYFHGLEALVVRQEQNSHEMALPLEVESRYSVINSQGLRLFCVGEVNTTFNRTCFGRHRPFVLQIMDCRGALILDIQRRCSCLLCFFGAGVYGSNAVVTLRTTNEPIGRIVQRWSCLTPSFTVLTPDGKILLEIKGPDYSSACRCWLVKELEFRVIDTKTGSAVGAILQHYSLQQAWSDLNDFGLRIDKGVEERLKALLLAAVFTINFSYFENSGGMFDNCWCCRCGECTGVKAVIWLLIFVILFGLLAVIMLRARGVL